MRKHAARHDGEALAVTQCAAHLRRRRIAKIVHKPQATAKPTNSKQQPAAGSRLALPGGQLGSGGGRAAGQQDRTRVQGCRVAQREGGEGSNL